MLKLYIGHASDGDSPRRKLMVGAFGDGNFSIPDDNFTMACSANSDGDITGFGLPDQDFIHNGKKLINGMDQSNRDLTIGIDA